MIFGGWGLRASGGQEGAARPLLDLPRQGLSPWTLIGVGMDWRGTGSG